MSYQTSTIPGVHPRILWDHGLDAQVDIFDAESIAGLIRHAATYLHSPILPYLRKLFGDLSHVTAGQVEAVGGIGYALRAEIRPDYDAESPRRWHNLTTLACFDSWRDYIDLSSDADDIVSGGLTGGLGEGVDLDADDVKRLSSNSWGTDEHRLRYRLLHLDGARGIRNVSTLRSGIGHVAADAHGRLDHDGALWVPRGVIAEHAPCPKEHKLAYTPARGWQYVDVHGVRTDAEAEVSAWADDVATTDLDTLSQYLTGEVYGVCFQVSNVDLDDEHAEADDYGARRWDAAPEGDLWGLYGDVDVDVSRAGSTAYWQALEALESDLSAVLRVREAERRTREAHAALLADLDKFDPGTAGLLRALWGPRFRYLTSHADVAEGLANEGLQLATTASGTPALIELTKD